MALIVARQGRLDVVDDHVAHPFGPVDLVHQIISQRRRGDLWNVFMFGDGVDLVQLEVAHADDIVFGDHDRSSHRQPIDDGLYHASAVQT